MQHEELLKSLSGAIDTAIKELVSIDTLSKGDVSIQEAKLRPESANGDLPGVTTEESVLKPEDAKKTEEAAKAESKDEDKNPDAKDDKKKDHKEPDGDEDDKNQDDDDDMDDDKIAKMKAKNKKYEDEKEASAQITKSEVEKVSETLKKSIVSHVEELQKSFGDRLGKLESLIEKLVSAPQPRQSVSGLAPLAKSTDDVAAAGQAQLNKAQVLDKLFEMQKSEDKRVDSNVISRVEMGDYSVLSERGINLK